MGGACAALLGLLFVVSIVLDRRAGDSSQSALARRLDTTNPTTISRALLLVAGVVLVLGDDDGVYVLVPALIAVLVGGVVNAWLILVKLTRGRRADLSPTSGSDDSACEDCFFPAAGRWAPGCRRRMPRPRL
jgi:O-antigen/teichoic acid export membrane protein